MTAGRTSPTLNAWPLRPSCSQATTTCVTCKNEHATDKYHLDDLIKINKLLYLSIESNQRQIRHLEELANMMALLSIIIGFFAGVAITFTCLVLLS